MKTPLANLLDSIVKKCNVPVPALDIAWIRLLVYGFFAYRLMCSDFSIFAYAPKAMLNIYPWKVYPFTGGYDFFGFPFIVDLCDFHWIHWIIPFPSQLGLYYIQNLAVIFCFLCLFFGRGPKRIFAITTYILLSYLWGYLWRSSLDIDSVFILLQICLLFCFSRQPEFHLFNLKCNPLKPTEENGYVYSIIILFFIAYYFASGIHKLTDINFIGWFQQYLSEVIARYYEASALGGPRAVPPVIHLLVYFPWFTRFVATPLVYLSHLTIPIIFFNRRIISKYMFFYLLFHSITSGMGILFPGLVLGWFCFFPVSRLFEPISLKFSNTTGFFSRYYYLMVMKFNWFGLIRVESNEAFEQIEGKYNLATFDHNLTTVRTNFYALRRSLWLMPLFWPLLIIFYIPFVPSILSFLYKLLMRMERPQEIAYQHG